MTDKGFIKLHRSILKWEWWQDDNTRNVFLWLLLNANWEDSRFQGHEIPKGSLVTSYAKIAESLGISVQTARTSINHLKSTNEITSKSTSKFTIVTIVNWEKYQCFDDSDNKQINKQSNIQLTSNQQATNNIKEIKNIRIKEDKKYSPYQNGRNPDFIALLEMETKGAVNK